MRLFVYGSLLTATYNRRLNKAMRRRLLRAQPAVIRARLYDLGAYPGTVAAARERVYGRLIAVADTAPLRQLDRHEYCIPGDLRRSEFIRGTDPGELSWQLPRSAAGCIPTMATSAERPIFITETMCGREAGAASSG